MKVEGFKSQSAGILVALVFALSFGGVGAFTSWVVGATLWGAWDASSWARVPAEVLHFENGHVQYRYEMKERTFLGHRIGIAAIDTDEGDTEVNNRIHKALNEKQPLEVLVDPDDPSRSVVDTTIPWTMVVGFLPFALGFSTVGLGALAVMVSMLLPSSAQDDEDETIGSDAGSGFLALAFFGFLWNVLAFPIAAVVILEALKTGEWLALLVGIFPLIGLLLIWGVINSGINWIRRGGAKVHPQHMPPRLGSPFSGHVAFPRGVTPGEAFKAVLSCTTTASKNQAGATHWKGEQQARVADVGGRRRLAFRFDPPERVPGFERDDVTQWHLELFPGGKEAAAFTFPFKMQPAAGVEHLPEEELRIDPDELAGEEPVPAGVGPSVQGLALLIGKERVERHLESLPQGQRKQIEAQLANMTPQQKATLEKAATYLPLVKKLVFWVIGLFILVQVIGVVSFMLFST